MSDTCQTRLQTDAERKKDLSTYGLISRHAVAQVSLTLFQIFKGVKWMLSAEIISAIIMWS